MHQTGNYIINYKVKRIKNIAIPQKYAAQHQLHVIRAQQQQQSGLHHRQTSEKTTHSGRNTLTSSCGTLLCILLAASHTHVELYLWKINGNLIVHGCHHISSREYIDYSWWKFFLIIQQNTASIIWQFSSSCYYRTCTEILEGQKLSWWWLNALPTS